MGNAHEIAHGTIEQLIRACVGTCPQSPTGAVKEIMYHAGHAIETNVGNYIGN